MTVIHARCDSVLLKEDHAEVTFDVPNSIPILTPFSCRSSFFRVPAARRNISPARNTASTSIWPASNIDRDHPLRALRRHRLSALRRGSPAGGSPAGGAADAGPVAGARPPGVQPRDGPRQGPARVTTWTRSRYKAEFLYWFFALVTLSFATWVTVTATWLVAFAVAGVVVGMNRQRLLSR